METKLKTATALKNNPLSISKSEDKNAASLKEAIKTASKSIFNNETNAETLLRQIDKYFADSLKKAAEYYKNDNYAYGKHIKDLNKKQVQLFESLEKFNSLDQATASECFDQIYFFSINKYKNERDGVIKSF